MKLEVLFEKNVPQVRPLLAVVGNFRTGKPQRVDRAVAWIFFTVAGSPHLRGHAPPGVCEFTNNDNFKLKANPPLLQMWTQNAGLLAFVKQVSPRMGLPFRMAMHWKVRYALSGKVLGQMEKAAPEIVLRECETSRTANMFTRTRDQESWTLNLMFNVYLEACKEKVAGLGPQIQRFLVSGLGGSPP